MTVLRDQLDKYVATRRALGYEFYRPAKALESFVRFIEARGANVITTELALSWAQSSINADPATRSEKLGRVRRFARFCKAAEPRTEVPPQGLLPHRRRRKPPYVYTAKEIRDLLSLARNLPSKLGLRALTYETLFGLIACTGMRVSEALGLDDVDWDEDKGVLTIRDSKFGKTRYVPVHNSTSRALRRYTNERESTLQGRIREAFFLTESQNRLSYEATQRMFRRLVNEVGIRTEPGERAPRIHDLRHSFAVRTLLEWYRRGVDVELHLPRLSTYLGHAHVTDTYWYLSAVPELMHLAMHRVELSERRRER